MQKQQCLTDKILFDYYMVSSIRENEVYTPFPFYQKKAIFNKMIESAYILDKLVKKITQHILDKDESIPFKMDYFELKDKIIGLDIQLPPFFWSRYDAFCREDGSIFFSEFNYDKPCAQREIAVSNMINPKNNPNSNFIEKFREGFNYLCKQFREPMKKLNVAVMVDPGHYEELHLAEFYIDVLKPLNCEFLIVGGKNIYTENGKVVAFGREIDVILRQFPTEYLFEIPEFEEILELYQAGKVLMINDPRAIIGQSKSLFATLWEMVEKEHEILTLEEIRVIYDTIPYTKVFEPGMIEQLRQNKDKYVIKASFGRYSEEVYIGKLYLEKEWEELIKYVSTNEKLHIVQDFCQIRSEKVLKFNGSFYEETKAFGNFGIYLVNGDFAGVSLRFSKDFLSCDDLVWISAVGLTDRSLYVKKIIKDRQRLEKWNKINDFIAFEHGYTGGYQGAQEAFLINPLILDYDIYDELKTATLKIAKIFKQTTDFVKKNSDIICPVLGIDSELVELITISHTELMCFIGRMDWVLDSKGDLKLLEFNSETPAGIQESAILNELILNELDINAINPNKDMKKLIKTSFLKIIDDYKKVKDIKNIGFVTLAYGEDWYNTTILSEIVNDIPINKVIGDVSGLEVRDNKLYLYGNCLDALYRYYPLDWLVDDYYYKGVINALKYGTLSINCPSTFISQSKAFMALVHELRKNGFYNHEQSEIIKKYIPLTTLIPKKEFEGIFCAKPYFGREGQGVTFGFKQPFYTENESEYIYQEWIDIQKIHMDVCSIYGSKKEFGYPVIGTYLIGDDFGGIYTRAGDCITDRWAVYVPTFIKKKSL